MAYYNGHYVFLPVSASVGYAEASGNIIDVSDSVGGLAVDCTISNAGGLLDVTLCGKNLCDGVLSVGIVGGSESTSYARKNLDFLPVGIYTLSFSPSIYWQSSNGVTVKKQINAEGGGTAAVVVEITNPSEAWAQFRCHDTATYPVPKDAVKMQIEFGETPTEYEAYTGQTVTMNYDGTVDGLTSTSGRMIIFTKQPLATITARYANSFDGYKMEFLK